MSDDRPAVMVGLKPAIVIVVAVLGATAYEARVRNGTGPSSMLIPGIPVITGTSEEEVLEKTKVHIKPSWGKVTVDIRTDPFLEE